MERYVFDNEKFITLVEPNSCLWDTSHELYLDRSKKHQCWLEICSDMYENFDELSAVQQNNYVKEIQKKWKSLRNSFARELARRKKSKNGVTWKTYMFFEQLSFLIGSTSSKETDSYSFDESQDPLDIKVENTIITATPEPAPKKKKVPLKIHKVEVIQLPKDDRHDTHEKPSEHDEDRLFLLSLLGDFKRVPAEKKLDAKLGMIQAIKAAISPTINTPNHFS